MKEIATVLAAVLGAGLTILGGFFLQRRQLSRSGGRVQQDLVILETALRVGVDQDLEDAIRARLRQSIREHTKRAEADPQNRPVVR